LNSSLVERQPSAQKVWRFKPQLGHVCLGRDALLKDENELDQALHSGDPDLIQKHTDLQEPDYSGGKNLKRPVLGKKFKAYYLY
jgi:hypothetical protein